LFAKTGLSRLFHDDFCQGTLSAGWLLLLFSKCMQVKKIKKAKTDAVAGGVTAEMEVIATDGYGGASSEEVLRKSKRLLSLPVCHFF
jgi:hypothetical protein